MGYKAFVLFVKCDLMEVVATLGFPSWATVAHPCPLCWCAKKNWSEITGLDLLTLPWKEKEWGDYDEACKACEIWVTVPPELFVRLRGSLAYDKRLKGNRGRCLKVDFPELEPPLVKGDRLEPNLELMSVRDIDSWSRTSQLGCCSGASPARL